ncbi:MAG: DUF2059 domain-containing protein [Rhodobacteraceae bacterium]|nr:MAG: DUF2059 domain-containing protein [Paracoccaceae bacterium]
MPKPVPFPSRVLRLACLALVLCAAWAATARPGLAADRARLEAFLEVTGFDVALESIRLSAGSAPQMLGVDASVFGSEWTRATDEVFAVEVMHDMAMDILEQTLSDDLLAHAADFYASDFGLRVVEIENASHMKEDDEAKQAEGQALVAGMLREGSPRLQLLQRMGRAANPGDTGVRAVQEIQFRFLMAASAAGVVDLQVDPVDLRAAMEADIPRLRRSLAESALAGNAYTYQSLNDDELLAYTEALEHPDMRRVYELMNAVQYEVMANRFEALAARMSSLRPGHDL